MLRAGSSTSTSDQEPPKASRGGSWLSYISSSLKALPGLAGSSIEEERPPDSPPDVEPPPSLAANLGMVRSMLVQLRTQPRELTAAEAAEAGRATSSSVMRPEAVADTLSMLEEDGKAVYIVFIAELAGDGDKAPAQRWCAHSRSADKVIAGVVEGLNEHRDEVVVVEAAVIEAEWRDEQRPHPFSVSRQFSVRSLPVVIEWRGGRVGERLPFPANSEEAAVRAFFARTSEAARKATAEAASGAGAALEASATKLRDVRLEATLDDDDGDDDAPAPG